MIEIASRGVIEAKASIMEELLLNKLAQMSWPKIRNKTIKRARKTDSINVTSTALFALPVLSAPSSLDTLVLSKETSTF